MPTDFSLSKEVQTYIDTLDLEYELDLPPGEREEAAKGRKAVEIIAAEVINSRETLADKTIKEIESLVRSDPDFIARLLDDHYTRQVLGGVSGYVRRTMELSGMDALRTPSEVTNRYLREATRTYILGLPQACVALCRAALEQSLKERLGYQLSGTFIKFHELLDDAERCHLLNKTTKQIAREVARDADDVLHEKPSDLREAADVLVKLRSLVQHIYSAEGHY